MRSFKIKIQKNTFYIKEKVSLSARVAYILYLKILSGSTSFRKRLTELQVFIYFLNDLCSIFYFISIKYNFSAIYSILSKKIEKNPLKIKVLNARVFVNIRSNKN
jgi:hypothetical protein